MACRCLGMCDGTLLKPIARRCQEGSVADAGHILGISLGTRSVGRSAAPDDRPRGGADIVALRRFTGLTQKAFAGALAIG